MTWWSAFGWAAVWVLSAGLPALLLAYWMRQRASAHVPSRLLTFGYLLAWSLVVVVPLAAAYYHESWQVAVPAALLAIFFGWALAAVLASPLSARALDNHVERRWRGQGLPSLSVGIVRRHELDYVKS